MNFCNFLNLNLWGLLFNVIGGAILGFSIIKSYKSIFFESFRVLHTEIFENTKIFCSVKEEMIKHFKRNPKSINKYYKDITGKDASEKEFGETEFYLNIFQYISLLKSRKKGIIGIGLLVFGFILQLISIYI